MVKYKLLIVVLISASAFGSSIQDVAVSNRSYPAIQQSLDAGYMVLDSQNRFNPNQSISRQDMATIIQKFDSKIKQKYFNLSQSDFEELLHLSNSFKTYIVNVESDITQLTDAQTGLTTDYMTLRSAHDTLAGEHLKLQKRETQTRWIALGAGLLSIIALATN